MSATQLRNLALTALLESPFNPRKHFDPAKLANLAASLKQHGQLTPALARPSLKDGLHFELAAGHRRFRAAKLADLTSLEVVVRDMTDAELIEILTIENDEREDVHPLEQADGYRLLMEKAGYDVAKIAARLDRGHDYVYARLRLLQLTPALKEHFLAGRFQLAHALILARLSPAEQARAAARPTSSWDKDGGLWRYEAPTLDRKEFPLVPNSPAELETWIAKEIRFNEDAIELEELFPATAAALEAAEETGTRVVAISRDSYLRPDVKDGKERTYTRDFWKRADELEGSKSCEYAVVGVIKAGAGRGESMGVCLRRDKCLVHWPKEARAAMAKEKAKKSGKPVKARKVDPRRAEKEEARLRAARVKERVAEARAERTVEVIEARFDALAKKPSRATVKAARAELGPKGWEKLTPEEFLVTMAAERITSRNLKYSLTNSWSRKAILQSCRALGVDVLKIEKGITIAHCKFCGCSEKDACRPACTWMDKAKTMCSAPACVALAQGKVVPLATVVVDELSDDGYDDDE